MGQPAQRKLIASMPDRYKTPGVTEVGMTGLQLFVGEGTPFGGEKPPRFANFTDGTVHTLMLVVGGKEVATEWTRPGGIPFAKGKIRDLLGSPPIARGYPMVFASANRAILPPDVSADLLGALVRHNDGLPVDHGALGIFAADLRDKERYEEAKQLVEKLREDARQQAVANRPN